MAQKIGHGSALQLGDGATPTEVFTSIVGVTQISFGSGKVDTIDTTEMLTAGTTRIYDDGLEAPGDVTVKLNIKPGDTTQTSLFTAKAAGGTHNFKVVYPGTVKTRAFAAIIVSIDEDIPDDKLPTYSLKLQVSGPIVDTYGS